MFHSTPPLVHASRIARFAGWNTGFVNRIGRPVAFSVSEYSFPPSHGRKTAHRCSFSITMASRSMGGRSRVYTSCIRYGRTRAPHSLPSSLFSFSVKEPLVVTSRSCFASRKRGSGFSPMPSGPGSAIFVLYKSMGTYSFSSCSLFFWGELSLLPFRLLHYIITHTPVKPQMHLLIFSLKFATFLLTFRQYAFIMKSMFDK